MIEQTTTSTTVAGISDSETSTLSKLLCAIELNNNLKYIRDMAAAYRSCVNEGKNNNTTVESRRTNSPKTLFLPQLQGSYSCEASY